MFEVWLLQKSSGIHQTLKIEELPFENNDTRLLHRKLLRMIAFCFFAKNLKHNTPLTMRYTKC